MALFERPMLSLRETQTKFAAAVLEGADAACAVYRNNVFGCLTRALANTYPVVEKLVGEGFFKYAASQDRKSTRLNSSHIQKSRMPSSA